jgi:hypothetical protein
MKENFTASELQNGNNIVTVQRPENQKFCGQVLIGGKWVSLIHADTEGAVTSFIEAWSEGKPEVTNMRVIAREQGGE